MIGLADDQLQPAPEFFDHRLKIFNELKAEYDAFVAGICRVIAYNTLYHAHTTVQLNPEKKSPSPCPMVLRGKQRVGKRVRWMSQKKCQRACLNVSSSLRYANFFIHPSRDLTTCFFLLTRSTVPCGIWNDLLRNHVNWNCSILNILKARRCSGIHRLTFWEKRLNVTMAAICAWVLLRMMVSSMRWLLTGIYFFINVLGRRCLQ